MSGTEEQIEIDLGDMPKVEETKVEEPVVEIIDETVEAVSEEKAPKDPEEALKKLQKKLDQQKKLADEAQERARLLEQQAAQAMNKASESDFHLVSSAIDRLNMDQDMLKAQLRDSMAIGDFDKAAEIQAAMVSNTTNLKQLERGLEEMKNTPRQPIQPVQRNQISVDDLIDKVTPRSAEWLRKNKEALPDERSIRIMGRAHEDAIDMGIIPESDDYFQFVESRLGIGNRKSEDQGYDAMSDAAKVTKNRQSPPAAPVSRSPADAPSRPGVVRLTAAEVEAAKISGISPQEYYKLKMQDRNRN
jgi:hypothetical protein